MALYHNAIERARAYRTECEIALARFKADQPREREEIRLAIIARSCFHRRTRHDALPHARHDWLPIEPRLRGDVLANEPRNLINYDEEHDPRRKTVERAMASRQRKGRYSLQWHAQFYLMDIA